MVGTTPKSSLRYAQQSDAPNAETAFSNLATDLDGLVVPKYASTAARGAANPSPTQGDHCYITSSSAGGRTLQRYEGGEWQSYFRGPLFTYKTADESVTSSVVKQDDNHLVLTTEANSTYTLFLSIQMTGHTSGDITWDLTFPSNASFYTAGVGLGQSATNTTDVISVLGGGLAASSPTTPMPFGAISTQTTTFFVHGLLIAGSSSGTVRFRWAQLSSNGTATTVLAGSYMTLTRVA